MLPYPNPQTHDSPTGKKIATKDDSRIPDEPDAKQAYERSDRASEERRRERSVRRTERMRDEEICEQRERERQRQRRDGQERQWCCRGAVTRVSGTIQFRYENDDARSVLNRLL